MFSGLIYYMGNDDGRTVPINSVTMSGIVYPFWSLGVATILLSLSIYFYLISIRIIQRAANRVRTTNFYYMGCEPCGEYYFFLLMSYIFLIVLGLYMYFRVGSSIIWASCVFLPLFYEAFVIFYANWKENDYLLLGETEAYNKKLKKRRLRKEKIDNMKQSVMKKMEEQHGGDEEAKMMMNEESLGMKMMDQA